MDLTEAGIPLSLASSLPGSHYTSILENMTRQNFEEIVIENKNLNRYTMRIFNKYS